MGDGRMREERHKRIRLTKRLLRPLPRRATLHRYPFLKWFAEAARKRRYLWSFRVGDMTPAFYFGAIIALLPILGIQIPVAFVVALVLRINLPTIIGLQLITNPLTAAGIYIVTYQVGAFLMQFMGTHVPGSGMFRAATELAIGGLVCGVLLGGALDLVYRFLAYEAQKHDWHLPGRRHQTDSASPDRDAGPNH